MKQRIRLTESQLQNVIRRCINEAYHYEGENEPKYNIIIGDPEYQELCQLLYDLGIEGLIGDKIQRLNWTYAHGRLEDDMQHDFFYLYNPNLPAESEESTSFFAYYKGKKCIIGQWFEPNFKHPTGLAVYADDQEAIDYMVDVMKNKKPF